MKELILFIIILTTCNTKKTDKINLENSVWKFSSGRVLLPDILAFSEKYLYMKNDSIYWHQNDSLIGIFDAIQYHYGERRLYIKDLKGDVGRYCEQ